MRRDLKMLSNWFSLFKELYPSNELVAILEEQATQLDEIADPIMQLGFSNPYGHYAKAAFARTWTQFLGIIEMVVSKNYHCGFILLRAHLEVLATTVYVGKYPQQTNNILDDNIPSEKRPSLRSRIQALAKEKGSGFEHLYNHLTQAFHFNEGRYILESGIGMNRESIREIDVKVYQDIAIVPARILLILSQITGEQIKALKALINVP